MSKLVYLHIVVLCVVAFIGCNDKSNGISAPIREHSTKPLRGDPVATTTMSTMKEVNVVEHDFGIVSPNQTLTHAFTIENCSAETWHFKEVVTSCGCTIAKIDSTSILPGKSSRIVLSLEVGSSTSDIAQKVRIAFRETDSVTHEFVLRAAVREKFTISPQEISLMGIHKGDVRTEEVFLLNYTKEHWDNVECDQLPAWLSAKVSRSDFRTSDNMRIHSAQERWMALLTVDGSAVPKGAHSELIRFSATSSQGGSWSKEVLVSVKVVPPLYVSPGKLFFGKLEPDREKQASFLVVLDKPNSTLSLGDFRLKHDLGDRLRFELHRLKDSVWRITAYLRPRRGDDHLNESMEISLKGVDGPPVLVPIIAQVASRRAN